MNLLAMGSTRWPCLIALTWNLAMSISLPAAMAATLIEAPTGQLPKTLSETGLLDKNHDLSHPAPILFEPRWPLWSNGSTKVRRIVVPAGAKVDTSNPADWKFPVGTLFFKTFSFETKDGPRPIETRLIRGLAAGWEFAVYRWNKAGTDAELMNISSATPLEIAGPDGKTIHHEIPNRLQCRQCHEANTNFIIGFSELNLKAPLVAADLRVGRRPAETPAATLRSQLEEFYDQGLLTDASREPTDVEDDELGSREIRGYFHGNCAHCHNGRERVDLSHDVFLSNMVSKKTRGRLFPSGLRIKPGYPEESLLYLAFSRSDRRDLLAQHMPPVGVQQPDTATIEKLHQWIVSLADKKLLDPQEADRVSPRSMAKTKDRAEGLVPNRHASSIMNPHKYALAFERIPIDGDHSAIRGFTSIRFLPNTNLFLLAEHEGCINLYELTEGKAQKRGEFRIPNVCVNTECGIVSMELDPDFSTNSFIYVGYCYTDQTHVKVSRLKLNLKDLGRTSETLRDVVQVDAPGGQPWHTIGSILFDRQKMMWVLLGERGLSAPAQDDESLLGSILRLNPSRDPHRSGYTVPADNPSTGWFSSRRRELVAKGLRNPWTGTFDSSGRLWIGEVGQKYEEINRLQPADGFHNFGWPAHDGESQQNYDGMVDPVISYTRSGDNAYARQDPGTLPSSEQCVWVGPEYRPHQTDRYAGKLDRTLLWGDLVLGWVRGLTLDKSGQIVDDRLLGNMPGITSWSAGPDDYFYVSTFAAYTQDVAAVFRVVPR